MKNVFNSSNIKPTGVLATEVYNIFEPLCFALNQSTYQPDDGKEHSASDWGMKIALGRILQALYSANYQERRSEDGKVFPSNHKRLLVSREEISALTPEDLETMKGPTAFHWLDVNEQRVTAMDTLIEEFRSVYRNIHKEEWTPMVQQQKPAANTTKVSDEVKAQMLARMADLKQPDVVKARINAMNNRIADERQQAQTGSKGTARREQFLGGSST